MKIEPNFSPKSIAITGATGLLGAHLSNFLLLQGHEVSALIKDENYKSILSNKVSRIYGDISNKSDIEYFIQKSNPTYFIHLAAQTQAYDALRYPYQTFFNNIIGTLNVLECLREYNLCEAIIVASSDKAYGELIGEYYTEEHQLRGVYPYDASKSSADLISHSYRVSYNMPIVTTRACNMYGIGDYNSQRLIPGLIASFLRKQKFTIRNQGSDWREYIHVEDVVSAYNHILKYASDRGPISTFNISSGDRHKTIEVFNLIQKVIGKNIDHEVLNYDSQEIRRQFMDSTLLSQETKWQPQKTMEKSISEIVEWYIENL
jgi:CDP-glucose 4,6-dehydratase